MYSTSLRTVTRIAWQQLEADCSDLLFNHGNPPHISLGVRFLATRTLLDNSKTTPTLKGTTNKGLKQRKQAGIYGRRPTDQPTEPERTGRVQKKMSEQQNSNKGVR